MKRHTLLILIAIMIFTGVSANAQFPNINKIKDKIKKEKTQETEDNSKNSSQESSTNQNQPSETAKPKPKKKAFSGEHDAKNEDYIFIGEDGLEKESLSNLRVCAVQTPYYSPAADEFEYWDRGGIEVSHKTYIAGRCKVLAYDLWVINKENGKRHKIDDFNKDAQGKTIYRVAGDKLEVIKKIPAEEFYIVVLPEVDKPGLALSDLFLCLPEQVEQFYEKKVKKFKSCRTVNDRVVTFQTYREYPSPFEASSSMFYKDEFEEQNKLGKFKGLKVYRLINDELVQLK